MSSSQKAVPPLTADAVLRKSDRSAWQSFDAELVLLDLPTRTLFGLNSVGGTVWERIDGKSTLAEIASDIASQFEQPNERVLADVVHFAGELLDRGCLELADVSPR
jgi:hypothetical protein